MTDIRDTIHHEEYKIEPSYINTEAADQVLDHVFNEYKKQLELEERIIEAYLKIVGNDAIYNLTKYTHQDGTEELIDDVNKRLVFRKTTGEWEITEDAGTQKYTYHIPKEICEAMEK